MHQSASSLGLTKTVALRKLLFSVAYIGIGSVVYWHDEPTIHTGIDALYFVAATMSTVGYGDHYPTTTGMRVFTIFMVRARFMMSCAAIVSVSSLAVSLTLVLCLTRSLSHSVRLPHSLSRPPSHSPPLARSDHDQRPFRLCAILLSVLLHDPTPHDEASKSSRALVPAEKGRHGWEWRGTPCELEHSSCPLASSVP